MENEATRQSDTTADVFRDEDLRATVETQSVTIRTLKTLLDQYKEELHRLNLQSSTRTCSQGDENIPASNTQQPPANLAQCVASDHKWEALKLRNNQLAEEVCRITELKLHR